MPARTSTNRSTVFLCKAPRRPIKIVHRGKPTQKKFSASHLFLQISAEKQAPRFL